MFSYYINNNTGTESDIHLKKKCFLHMLISRVTFLWVPGAKVDEIERQEWSTSYCKTERILIPEDSETKKKQID